MVPERAPHTEHIEYLRAVAAQGDADDVGHVDDGMDDDTADMDYEEEETSERDDDEEEDMEAIMETDLDLRKEGEYFDDNELVG